jgi:hypothetical protein
MTGSLQNPCDSRPLSVVEGTAAVSGLYFGRASYRLKTLQE